MVVIWEDGFGRYWVPEQTMEQWKGWNGQLEVHDIHIAIVTMPSAKLLKHVL